MSKELKPGWKMVKFGDVVRQCRETVDRDNNPFERYVDGGSYVPKIFISAVGAEFGQDYVGPAFHRHFSVKGKSFTAHGVPILKRLL